MNVQQNIEGCRGLPVGGQAPCATIDFTDIRSRCSVEQVAIALLNCLHGKPEAESLRHLTSDRGFQGKALEAPVVQVDEPRCFLGRSPANEFKRSRARILTVERTLRPFQHFDTLEIEKLKIQHGWRYEIDIVDIDSRGRVVIHSVVVQPHSANTHIGDTVTKCIVDIQIGGLCSQVHRFEHAQPLHVFAAKGRNGDPHVAEVLLTLLRGYYNLFQSEIRRLCNRNA